MTIYECHASQNVLSMEMIFISNDTLKKIRLNTDQINQIMDMNKTHTVA